MPIYPKTGYTVTGYTPTYRVKPANKEQLIALRDVLLEWKDENAAMAVDNVIDILSRAADPRTPIEAVRKESHLPMIQKMIDMGTLDANGNILPYKPSKVVGGSWDNHEVHSWTVDGE